MAASHRLHSARLSEGENRATYGKCNNPHGHGHNYLVQVTLSGQIDSLTGMVCNLGELDCIVTREVLERFDHQNLNCMPEFRELVPTSENLCRVIYGILRQQLTAAHLERVRLEETSMNSFEYGGEETAAVLTNAASAPASADAAVGKKEKVQ